MNYLKNLRYYIIPLLVAFFNILIIITPNIVIPSAKNGLLLWFNKILPSILPFLIGTNILIHLGFVDFIGVLLNPFMKILFNVSGSGAFALVLGMLSGYPIGAKITANLRENEKISKVEAQRLISFTNNCAPLFVIGVIGVSMFKSAKIGYLILLIHYLSAMTVGLFFRFYKLEEIVIEKKCSLKYALLQLKLVQLRNKKTIGEILSQSVKSSLETVSMIGGFIIIFSVIAELLKASNIFAYLGNFILPKFLQNYSNPLFIGLIEMTNGINLMSSNKTVTSIILTCGIISFSGFSIMSQTASMIYNSDIKMSLYILSKIMHFFIAIFYAILCKPIFINLLKTQTSEVFYTLDTPLFITHSIKNLILGIIILIVASFLLNVIFRKKFKY